MAICETTIGELVNQGALSIFTGPFGSVLHSHDYTPTGTPIVPTEAIGRRILNTATLPRISEETAVRLRKYRIQAGDILFARRGAQATGLSALASEEHDGWIAGTGTIVLRIHNDGVDPTYLSFWLSSEASFRWLRVHAVGAVMPNLNSQVLSGLPVRLPPKGEQKAVAYILGTLDNKIELNQRMNETLEAMARAIFKSWFVDFDPVRAKMDGRKPLGMDAATAAPFPEGFEETALGSTPQGWRVMALPEAIEVNPKRTLPKGTISPYLDMKNMPARGHCPDDIIYRAFSSGTKFSNGDTLLARITPCLENGKTAFVDFFRNGEVGWGSTEYIVFHPKPPLPTEFGYYLARSDDLRSFAIHNMTGTSGRQRVPSDCFNQYLLSVPPERIARRFGDCVRPLVRQISANAKQSRALAAIRDALLPKLLTGEVRIADADRKLEASRE